MLRTSAFALGRRLGRLTIPNTRTAASGGAVDHHDDHHPDWIDFNGVDRELYKVGTWDEYPIPSRGYKQEYDRVNSHFNIYMGLGVVFCVVSYAYGFWIDIFDFKQGRAPAAYRNRTNDFYEVGKVYENRDKEE